MYASNSFKVQVSMHIVSNVWVCTICAVLKDSIILWYNKLRVQQQCNTDYNNYYTESNDYNFMTIIIVPSLSVSCGLRLSDLSNSYRVALELRKGRGHSP